MCVVWPPSKRVTLLRPTYHGCRRDVDGLLIIGSLGTVSDQYKHCFGVLDLLEYLHECFDIQLVAALCPGSGAGDLLATVQKVYEQFREHVPGGRAKFAVVITMGSDWYRKYLYDDLYQGVSRSIDVSGSIQTLVLDLQAHFVDKVLVVYGASADTFGLSGTLAAQYDQDATEVVKQLNSYGCLAIRGMRVHVLMQPTRSGHVYAMGLRLATIELAHWASLARGAAYKLGLHPEMALAEDHDDRIHITSKL